MTAAQVELIITQTSHRKIGSAAIMIGTITNIGELLKCKRCVVLQPQLDVVVDWKFGAFCRLALPLVWSHCGSSSKSKSEENEIAVLGFIVSSLATAHTLRAWELSVPI